MTTFFQKNKLFVLLATINLLSKLGDRIFYVVMLTVASSLPKANLAIIMVSFSETFPILLSLFLGVIADKQKQKIGQLIGSSLFRVVMYLVIGLIFKYPSTLTLVIFVSLLNLFSDISGNYSTALFSPFTKVLVNQEDMEKAQGFISLGTQLVTVLSTFIGAFLLGIFSKSILAFSNAILFLFVALFYWTIQFPLKAQTRNVKTLEHDAMFTIVKENIKSILSDDTLLINLIQLSMLNGFFGGLTPLFALYLKDNSDLGFLSHPIKISLLSGMITLFMVLGNSLTASLFRKYSIFQITIWSDMMIFLVGVGFIANSIWIIFLSNAFLSFFIGIVAPRFSTDIINRYSVERIGGIITSVNAFLAIVPPLTSLIFPILSTISLPFAYSCFIVYAIILIIVSLFLIKKNSSF